MFTRAKKILSLVLVVAMVVSGMAAVPSASAADGVKLDPSVEYQTMEGWGTSIVWWGNTVGTWIGVTNEKSIAYGLSLNPPIENMEVRDAIIHMFFSPDGLNMNMARFCVGGGDKDEYANTTIQRIEAMCPGWSIDMYGDSNSNNGGVIAENFYSKPIRQMNDYGQLYVLKEAARLRQEACAKEGKASDFVVEVFSNSPPFYMTESGYVTGALRVNAKEWEPSWPNSEPNGTGNADNLVKDKDMADFAAYMATAAKYMDNMLAPYGAKVDMLNPFNEPGCRYWGADHGGNMYKQEGCNVSYGALQNNMLRKMRTALDAVGMQSTFLTMGETDYGTTLAGYGFFDEDVKDMLPLIGTHAYDNESGKVKGSNNINRVYLRDLMKSDDKTLWQIELGQGNGDFLSGQMNGARALSRSISNDLKTAQVSAWMDWNPCEPLYDALALNGQNQVSSLGGWGLMSVNTNSTAYGIEGVKGKAMFGKPAGPYAGVVPAVPNVPSSYRRQSSSSLFTGTAPNLVPKTEILEEIGWGDYAYAVGKSYYAHMQYSKYIKLGYTQIDIGNDQMVAFVSPDQKELVVVAYTYNNNTGISTSNASIALVNSLSTTVDLSAFPGADVAEVYRTTAGTSQASWGESCARIADQDVSAGELSVSMTSNQVCTFVVKNSLGNAIYTKNRFYDMVNSEVVYKGAKYSNINKFAYSGLDTAWVKKMWHEPFPLDPAAASVFTPSPAFALKYMSWENTYRPTYYTMGTPANVAASDTYKAYDHSVRRATADGASAAFVFDGNSAAIWGLLKGEDKAASYSVSLDGQVVAAGLSNAGEAGTNACLFNTGILFTEGPHTLIITKNGEAGELDIGNAKVGHERSSLYSLAISCLELNAANYTAGSFARMTAALDAAKALMADENATQADYDSVYAALLNATVALVPAGQPDISSVSVTTPTVVETLAANLRVSVAGENLDGKAMTAYLEINGELKYPAAVENGQALIRVTAMGAATDVCKVVVKGESFAGRGECPLNVVAYKPAELWAPAIAYNTELGKLVVTFAEDITPKAGGYKITVAAAEVAFTQSDSKTLTLDSAPGAVPAGSKVIVAGVKYAALFPSYSFTFTLVAP